MTKKLLYRFRSLENLLGTHQELEQQSIYFSGPNKLNDPMEGAREVYWSGCNVNWTNLYRNYIRSFTLFCFLVQLESDDSEEIEELVDKCLYPNDLHVNLLSLIEDVESSFCHNSDIEMFIARITKYRDKVSEEELKYYLSIIHTHALNSVFYYFENKKLVPNSIFSKMEPSNLKLFDDEYFIAINKIIEKYGIAKFKTQLIGDLEFRKEQSLRLSISTGKKISKKVDVLVNTFPFSYVNSLYGLMYREWYVACFMESAADSSIWGTYGVGHTAVCLIFETEKDKNNDFYISLNNSITGWDKDGPRKGKFRFRFYKVRYEFSLSPINFFEYLGAISITDIYRNWHYDKDGNESKYIQNYDDSWRKKYWEHFYKTITQKTKDWSKENEYRLIINNMSGTYSGSVSDMTLNYDFKSLHGLIFGINTPESDKLKIIDILHRKIKENGHYDFVFYQAEYSKEESKVVYRELSYLKLRP